MKEYFENIVIWMLIAFCFGTVLGGSVIYRFNVWQLDQATTLGNMIHKDIIWDLKKRI